MSAAAAVSLQERWPVLTAVPPALAGLCMRADLGIAPRTLDGYARGLSEYLALCADLGADPVQAKREHVARFVRHLAERPARHAGAGPSSPGCPYLSNATVQQRLTAVCLFYDHLVEDGLRDANPVGRGRYAPAARVGGDNRRGLVPRQVRLPWIPDEADWRAVLEAARREPIRNRAMLALGYDAGLRREELCSLRTGDLDPGHRLLRVRAETTKSRHERVVPYSAAGGELRDRTAEDMAHRASRLNLVVNAIVLWNTTYLARAVEYLRAQGVGLTDEVLSHIAPVRWSHVAFTGDYVWTDVEAPPCEQSRPRRAGRFRPEAFRATMAA